MSAEDIARVLKLLEKVGYDGSKTEFTDALNKFGQHPEAVAALRRGVDRRGKVEDRGSYCESASSGYGLWWDKNDMLNKLDLADDRAFLGGFNTAALPRAAAPAAQFAQAAPANDETVEELREQVRELTKRVTRLEANPSRYKLGPGA